MKLSVNVCLMTAGLAVSLIAQDAMAFDGRDRYVYTLMNPVIPSGNVFAPAINNAGAISFIHRATGRPDAVMRLNADWSSDLMSGPEGVVTRGNITSNGDVAYVANVGSVRGAYRSSGPGGSTLIASTAGDLGSIPPSPGPLINSSGQVLFHGISDGGVAQLFQSDSSGIRLVADSAGPLRDFSAIAQNDYGHTAYSSRMDSGPMQLFYEKQGITTDTGLVGMISMAMNNHDLIAATAGGLVMGWTPTGGTTTLLDGTGGLGLFSHVSINNQNEVVVRANDSVSGKRGIFTGSDRINDVVASVGDDLPIVMPDGTVSFFQISELTLGANAMNDSGQIVFAANGAGPLFSGTAIIIATPIPASGTAISAVVVAMAVQIRRRRV
jgi:hypothetical protein